MRSFIAAILALLVISGSAWAQTKRPALTGNPIEDIKAATTSSTTQSVVGMETKIAAALAKPFQDLASFINSDAQAAVELSTAISGLEDGHGQQCWMAMGTFTAVLVAHPIPVTLHAMTDLEAFRLANMAANQLCANVHCTQVFSDLSNAVTSVGAQVGGAVTSGLQIPSLNSLCSKIPQVTVVVPVTPAASTK